MKWVNQAFLIKIPNIHFPVKNATTLKPLLIHISLTISCQCFIFIPSGGIETENLLEMG